MVCRVITADFEQTRYERKSLTSPYRSSVHYRRSCGIIHHQFTDARTLRGLDGWVHETRCPNFLKLFPSETNLNSEDWVMFFYRYPMSAGGLLNRKTKKQTQTVTKRNNTNTYTPAVRFLHITRHRETSVFVVDILMWGIRRTNCVCRNRPPSQTALWERSGCAGLSLEPHTTNRYTEDPPFL